MIERSPASPANSEWLTRRQRIDPQLKSAGWTIVDHGKYDPTALTNHDRCALVEYPTENGPADYALCIGGQLLGIVEAKKLSLGPQNVLTQAVPPLPEQQEIVRRVEALFTLADQLEARYLKAKAHVDRLTQSILAKAFRGELVPQDGNDEPAAVMLERIRTQRSATAPLTRRSAAPSPRGRGDHKDKISPRTARKDSSPLPEGEGGRRPGEGEQPLVAEAQSVYTPGGQAALPAANQPVPGRNIPKTILSHMQPGIAYSRADIADALGLSVSDWNWAIRQLKEEGRVVQTGERRGARYNKLR